MIPEESEETKNLTPKELETQLFQGGNGAVDKEEVEMEIEMKEIYLRKNSEE
jgi:hypothetical protein